MITERLKDDKEGIAAAAKLLKNGGTVAIPTETVYGLAANACDEQAVRAVFFAKGRPQDNPLIVHIASMPELLSVAKDIPQKAYEMAEKFWPGPLTMVLPRGEKIPASVSAGLDTVAVRMPSCKAARDIITAASVPLAAPSANLSGSPSPTTAQHVLDDLDGKINAVVMSDDCAVGVESTVVSLCTNPPRLLRPGGITVEQLKTVLPDIVIDKAVLSEPEKGKPVSSPGMKYKHYSPKTNIVMIEGSSQQFVDYVNQIEDCGVMCFAEELPQIRHKCVVCGHKDDMATQAEELFLALRKLDALNVSTVYAHAPQKSGIGLAVYNRLIRAAAFKVVSL